MRWPWNRNTTPSALAQTTALIDELILEHQAIVKRHHEILDQARKMTDQKEAEING